MTILGDEVVPKTVETLLAEPLRIPAYQRPYSWRPATALQLLDDIQDFLANQSSVPYVMGAVILHKENQKQAGSQCSGAQYFVVDGQQRLLTLRMALQVLAGRAALPGTFNPESPVGRVFHALRDRFSNLSEDDKGSLRKVINTRCEVLQVVTDDLDEAFQIFDSQNYRGKSLAPHDLLKAHHLRAMRGESATLQVAVVETWEKAGDHNLDRLFSTYLYRIRRWCRGKPARRFTVDDIDMFKGMTLADASTPSARYHLAAQLALPLFDAWSERSFEDAADDQAAGHARFQLDAPVVAGKPFFEMVEFMLEELRHVRESAYDDCNVQFASSYKHEESNTFEEISSKSHYRKVSELYLAALLFYRNKFGTAGLEQAKFILFRWAYARRAELIRVQAASIDNMASGKDRAPSPFVLMRDSAAADCLHRIKTGIQPRSDRPGHEPELVKFLSNEKSG